MYAGVGEFRPEGGKVGRTGAFVREQARVPCLWSLFPNLRSTKSKLTVLPGMSTPANSPRSIRPQSICTANASISNSDTISAKSLKDLVTPNWHHRPVTYKPARSNIYQRTGGGPG